MVRFTVRDVEAMLGTGILPEDATTELLHGVIVMKDRSDLGDEPTVIGKKHRYVVTQLTNLAGQINSPHEHVQIQNPVVCGDDEAPEPDFAIVRGPVGSFKDSLPMGTDVTCVIEVADSSLERDSEEKIDIYAAAGVPQYLVLNLRNRTAQSHSDPDDAAAKYRLVSVIDESADLQLRLPSGGTFCVRLATLLP
jgi:hypothetical protein